MIKKIIFTFILLLISTSFTFSENINYLDLYKVLNTSVAGSKAQKELKKKIENNTSLAKDISLGAFDGDNFKKFADDNGLLVKDYKISNLKQNEVFGEGLVKQIFLTKKGEINLITNNTLTKSFLISTKKTDYIKLDKDSNEFGRIMGEFDF